MGSGRYVTPRRIQTEPPAGVMERWQPELDRIAPRTMRPTWLRLAWLPGYPWQPVERWVIYQMVPLRYLGEWGPGAAVRDSLLHGPDPARVIGFDTVRMKLVRHGGPRPLVDRWQYRLFRETGAYAQPLWVVQGSQGGHKRAFDDVESSISVMNGGPEQPPAPGELPYAEPDMRTIAKLRELDLVGVFKDCVRYADMAKDELDRWERDRTEEMRRQLWNWLGSQVSESLTFTRAQIEEIKEHAVPAPEPDYERIEEEFITEPV